MWENKVSQSSILKVTSALEKQFLGIWKAWNQPEQIYQAQSLYPTNFITLCDINWIQQYNFKVTENR